MAPAIAAVVAFVLFWALVLGMRLILRDSLVDPIPALLASIVVAGLAYRTFFRHRM